MPMPRQDCHKLNTGKPRLSIIKTDSLASRQPLVNTGNQSERKRNSLRSPVEIISMIAESSLISRHLMRVLDPLLSLTSASSPASRVRPFIMAVRRGGPVMPLSTRLTACKGGVVGGGACGWGGIGVRNKGALPFVGLCGASVTDMG